MLLHDSIKFSWRNWCGCALYFKWRWKWYHYYLKTIHSSKYENYGHQFTSINNLFPKQEGDGVVTARSKFTTSEGLRYDKKDHTLIIIKASRNQLLTLVSCMKTYIHSTDPKSSNINLLFIT